MREQRIGRGLAIGQFQRGGESMATFAGELKAFRSAWGFPRSLLES